MKPRILLVSACLALVASYVFVRGLPSVPIPRATAPVAAVVSVPAQPAAFTGAKETDPALNTERDPTVVFQRAFWRRPGAGDRVLHGERRDWIDASAVVRKWQWFVAVAPSPEFHRWLLGENPFELSPVAAERPAAVPDSAPAWFDPAKALAGFAQYRNPGGNFAVFHDEKTGRIFATDAGSGFVAAVR